MPSLAWSLSVRIERPIVSCEIAPNAYLTIKGGAIDNAARAKLLETNPHFFRYRWYRGNQRQLCANQGCPRAENFSPAEWSFYNLGGPCLLCAACVKAKSKSSHRFCSKSCFKIAWANHNSTCHRSSSVTDSASSYRRKDSGDGSLDESIDPDYIQEISDTTLDDDWILVSDEQMYKPSVEDVGYMLRVDCFALSTTLDQYGDNILLIGPVIVHSEPVLNYPTLEISRDYLAPYDALDRSNFTSNVRIVSYNILAEIYATKQAYPYCDTWSLSWAYRRSLLLQELSRVEGDIICLQEVQSDHYETQLLPEMRSMGYEGLYQQKSREDMGQYGKVDGCCIFYNPLKYDLIDYMVTEFNEIARNEAVRLRLDETEKRKFFNRLCKDNIAMIAEFQSLPSNGSTNYPAGTNHFCVVNTHLYSNHRQPDVKLWQTYTMISQVQNYVTARQRAGISLGVIVCGDFNSEPESAVYGFMRDGALTGDYPELAMVESEPGYFPILPDVKRITHNLHLASSMISSQREEPLFTNYTSSFKGSLDYIWYTSSHMRVLSTLSMTSEEEILKYGFALPNTILPSDHLMLSCDIGLIIDNSKRNNESSSRSMPNQNQGSHNYDYKQQSYNNSSKSSGSGRNRK